MHKELSYLNAEGYTVFTSQFHKNRGTCCKTGCLHCPFGHTLKKFGLEFSAVQESDHIEIDKIITESGNNFADWRSFLPENILFVKIKGTICGVILKNHIVIKHVFLLPHFQNQDLSKEMLESYLFI